MSPIGSVGRSVRGRRLPDAIPDSVVSRWQFNDDSDTSTATDSESNNDGAISGASYTQDSIEGSHALEFDGVDDFVNLGEIHNSQENVGTIGCWVNANSFSTSDTIFETNDYRFAIGFERVGNNGIEGRGFDGTDSFVIESGESTANEWFHVALTWDGSTLEFYVDAISQGTESISAIDITEHDDFIGNRRDLSNPVDGRIDDAFYSDVAMSQSEIEQMKNLA